MKSADDIMLLCLFFSFISKSRLLFGIHHSKFTTLKIKFGKGNKKRGKRKKENVNVKGEKDWKNWFTVEVLDGHLLEGR